MDGCGWVVGTGGRGGGGGGGGGARGGGQTLDDTRGRLLAVKMVPLAALGALPEDGLRAALALRHPNLVGCARAGD